MSNAWKVVQMLDAWSFDSRIQEIGADRVIKEAADEIEKLRAALNSFVAAVPKDCVLVSRAATEQMSARIVAFETEIKKLGARGCARDQTTTQYCAEVIERDAEIEKLRAALRQIRDQEPERQAWSVGVARAALGEKE